MEQQNRPSAPQQVVNISQVPMEDNKTLKDAYSTTAATILGVFQIIIGVLSFLSEVYVSQNHGPDLIFFSWRCIFWLGFCVLLCLRRNCHRRSSKWQQVPCGGHHGDEHHLCPLCTCPCDLCDLSVFSLFRLFWPIPQQQLLPLVTNHLGAALGDRAHHLGFSHLPTSLLSEGGPAQPGQQPGRLSAQPC